MAKSKYRNKITRKLTGNLVRESQDIMKVPDPRDNDIIIPVMGPTGVGKSTIINCITGRDVLTVGHDLQSCTSSVHHVIIPHPIDQGRRILLVEMPGFDNTYASDAEILKRIALWLARSYHDGMKLSGLIYLHEISQARISGTGRKNLDMFRKLCGDDGLRNVVLGTTKWGNVTPEVGREREQRLGDTHWHDMIQHGSVIMQAHPNPSSAWEIVNHILRNRGVDFVRIQEELLELQKVVPDTEAGQTLRYMLKELLERQKELVRQLEEETSAKKGDVQLQQQVLENKKRMGETINEIQKLEIPLGVRVRGFFGL